MKLKNKKTGEIGRLQPYGGDGRIWVWIDNISRPEHRYSSLAKLNEEWEDYEEPKEYWAIDCFSPDGELVSQFGKCSERIIENRKQIGNYFETKEEAEKAAEKLKAWKRLKDFGCGFMLDDHFTVKFVGPDARKITSAEEQKSLSDAFKLLFGGKE